MELRVTSIQWKPAWRVIPSRFLPIDLFERVTAPEDLDAIIELESLTNDRLRNDLGQIHLVPPDERVYGPGASVIMAAFTHLSPVGSRFSAGQFGVFYASLHLDTAVAETRFHRERFLSRTAEPPMELDMRVYNVDLQGEFYDIREDHSEFIAFHDPNSYELSQKFGAELKAQHATGIVYRSVRHVGGINSAVFSPKLLKNCRQERHLCYVWDGKEITTIYRKELLSA